MNKKPLISVIMNCYNGEIYLKESLASLFKQTYKNWELIFWDNFSTDNSYKILKNFKDRRIKYFFTKKHSKLYKARNLAIKKATGEFVCFLDTDDIWNKDFLKSFLKKMTTNRCDIACAKYKIRNYKTKKTSLNEKKSLPKIIKTQNLLDNYVIGVSSIMLRRKIFKKYRFNSNYQIIGDFDLFLKLSSKYDIHSIDKPLLTYRLHDQNFSVKKMNIHIDELNNWYRSFSKKNKKIYNLNKLKLYIFKWNLKFYLNRLF
tara:strand:- start:43 stop:819 length:777 start_codon:yes stop_codon:yes gene_type:complete